jgi:hypothetical protein
MRLGAAVLIALPILASISPACASEAHPAGQIFRLADARDAYRSLPLLFEPNRGQSDPRVKFMARSQGLTLFLTSTDAVLVTREATLKMRVLGANPNAVALGLDELPGRIHSLIGRDPRTWRTDGRAYARVLYREIYPGIDLAYYGTRHQGLEYDFVVAPGANPRAIRLGLEGADRIELSAEGDLLLHVGAASLRFGKPVVYQHVGGARREIQGVWVREGAATVGFQVAAYDPSAALVIDPIVSLATYLGGFGADQAFAVAIDTAGAVYVTGNTTSANFPTTPGSFGPTSLGAIDAFIVKLSPDLATTVYSTYLGGTTGDDAGRGIAVDSGGNAYVTGFTNSTDFPTTAGAFQTASGAGVCSGLVCNDAFVVKLDPTGATLLYGTYLGGNESDVGLGIAVDATGNAHVTGGTFSTNFPTTAGAVQPTATAGGSREAFVTKLNPLGAALAYSTFLGGTGDDVGNAIALSASNVAYVTGSTESTIFPVTVGALQTSFGGPAGGTDAFVTALGAGGALVYSTFLGGIASDEGLSIAVDGGGNAYVTGATSSLNFPATGVFTFTGTTTQAFLTELNPAGAALVVSRAVPTGRLDTTARDPASPSISVGIARDGVGNLFISGSELRCVGLGCVVNTDAFVVSLDPTATSTTAQFVGGTGDDFGLGMAVDSGGSVFLVGDTTSANFPVTASAVQTTFGGTTDAFVVMISQLGMIAGAPIGNSSNSPCFIATAAFGSPMAREVGVLREFRDDVLLPHAAGRAAVAAYYRIGPAFARVIAGSELLKALVRTGLAPMIWLAPFSRGHAALTFYLVVGAASLAAGLLVVAVAARRAGLGRRRALAVTFVTALVVGSGVALLDLVDHPRSDVAAAQHRQSPAVGVSAVDPGSATTRPPRRGASEDARSVPGIRAIGADRYLVEPGASGRSLPDLARLVTVWPTLAGVQIMSDIGDGILTADGLLVTDPKLAASAGIEAGDRILAINGHPPAGGFFLAVVKLRRDPDSGPVRVEVDRAGRRIEKTVVMR